MTLTESDAKKYVELAGLRNVDHRLFEGKQERDVVDFLLVLKQQQAQAPAPLPRAPRSQEAGRLHETRRREQASRPLDKLPESPAALCEWALRNN